MDLQSIAFDHLSHPSRILKFITIILEVIGLEPIKSACKADILTKLNYTPTRIKICLFYKNLHEQIIIYNTRGKGI